MNELKARLIDGWVSSVIGVVMLGLGFAYHKFIGDNVYTGLIVAGGLALIAKKGKEKE